MEVYTIRTGYKPHEGQRKFHESNSKFKAIITGIAFGKTVAGVNEILKNAILYPEATHLILAPNSKIMRHATLPVFFRYCPLEIVERHIKSFNTIILKNGAKIIYLTADNQRHIARLRGLSIGSF